MSRSFRMSHLRKVQECEQVAAVCYRLRGPDIEFLLVRTRGARWTFPKGSAEAGLTLAQAAACEAFEEAGVHGRIEEDSFIRYSRQKFAVNAYLCEVLRLGPPQESGRKRTWFSAEKAKRRLREGRNCKDGVEFARVVDRAVSRIRRLGSATGNSTPVMKQDPLRKARMEASLGADFPGPVENALAVSLARYFRRQSGNLRRTGLVEAAVNAYLSRVAGAKALPPSPAPELNGTAIAPFAQKANRRLRPSDATGKVQFIDSPRQGRSQGQDVKARER
jgi:8-oxo-dGTP pyrophosphatase MutT (NUDIX family)